MFFHFGVTAINIAEVTVQLFEDRDIRLRANGQVPSSGGEFRVQDWLSNAGSSRQWNSHVQKLGHHIAHAD